MKKMATMLAIASYLACNSPETKVPAADTLAKKHTDTTATLHGDNLVKAEAPDAGSEMEQGYCLPRGGNGKMQSPINILTSEAGKDDQKGMIVKFQTDIVGAENLGHTVQLDFKEGSICMADGKTYNSKQFHFHTPSEHLIDGMTFPMEMHIVNTLKDSTPNAKPSYLVIGILFKMGKENKFIKEFLKDLPSEEGHKDSIPSGSVNLNDLANEVVKSGKISYFSYDGSLTTPPFSESVKWVVIKQIVEASPDQIIAIEKLEGNNARHVQSVNGRKIVSHS
ncbi:MAG: carbonic anhydrase [Bacteroidetes bacterium]|nr:MAG: carbonic anhydrase [Bacteroidota bacterium]